MRGKNAARKERVKQLAFMLMMHTNNRAIQMIKRPSDPVNGLENCRRLVEDWEPVNRSIPIDADTIAALSLSREVEVKL